MFRFLRASASTSVAISALVWPACAQTYDPNTISAGNSKPYAGYYAPYAILAFATYYPQALKKGDDGTDVVDQTFTAENVKSVIQSTNGEVSLADIRGWSKEELGFWRYQFGGDAKELCYNNNQYCKQHAPHSWQYHYPGPKFQVWAKQDGSGGPGRAPPQSTDSCSEVSIGFRGTTPTRGDWISNVRLVPGIELRYDTSYTWLRRNIDAIISDIRGLDCYAHAKSPPIIVSLGHSLGGGLAQLAALANDPTQPRIEKVFAFDSSPETGGDLVEEKILHDNATGLEIDRVGQVEDASKYLQQAVTVVPIVAPYVRKVPYVGRMLVNENEFFPADDSRCNPGNPAIRHVRIDLDSTTGGPVGLHSMSAMAAQFVVWSGRERKEKEARNEAYQIQEPPQIQNCPPTRYYIRKQKEVPAPAPSSALMAYAPSPAVVAPQPTQQVASRAQRRFYALAPMPALSASDYVPAANVGARAAGNAWMQWRLADQDAQPALTTRPKLALTSAHSARTSAKTTVGVYSVGSGFGGQLWASVRGRERLFLDLVFP